MYGPPGAGKKTRISCLLKELYGTSTEKVKLEQQTFEVYENCYLFILPVISSCHISVLTVTHILEDFSSWQQVAGTSKIFGKNIKLNVFG